MDQNSINNFIDLITGVFAPVEARLDRLEETINMMARRISGKESKIRVLFLVNHATSWSATFPVLRDMMNNTLFECLVFSLPHRNDSLESNMQWVGEEEISELLHSQNVPHVRITSDRLEICGNLVKAVDPDIVFRQKPWDYDIPEQLSTANLMFAKLCYIPYGYLTAAIQPYQFDQEFHRVCWRIFCPDVAHKEMFRKYCAIGDFSCRVTGYPKFDELISQKEEYWPINLNDTNKPNKIIWAPHWTPPGHWYRFGAFDHSFPRIYNLAKKYPELEIVLRPHPILADKIKSCVDSTLNELIKIWNNLPNTSIDYRPEYSSLFAASDMLITDGVSFLTEYQLFDKPLIFIECSDCTGFNEIGLSILDGVYRLNSDEEMEGLILQLLDGNEKPNVVAARRTYANSLINNTSSSANIINSILDGLGITCC